MNLSLTGQRVGSLPAPRRHTAHLDFSSAVIGLIKSWSLPGPADERGVGGQTADGCPAQTETAQGDGAGGSGSGINTDALGPPENNLTGTQLLLLFGLFWTLKCQVPPENTTRFAQKHLHDQFNQFKLKQ